MRDASGAAEYHYVAIDYIRSITGGELRAGDDVRALSIGYAAAICPNCK
jgi:hypothetical protein